MLQIKINNGEQFEVEEVNDIISVNGSQVAGDIQVLPNGLLSVIYNNKSYTAIVDKVDKKNKELTLRIDGTAYQVSIKEKMDLLLEEMGMDLKSLQKAEPVKAPMPGMILEILVKPGQEVVKGDGLIILEAMKMENVLKATADGKVKAINCKERAAVEKGVVLIEME